MCGIFLQNVNFFLNFFFANCKYFSLAGVYSPRSHQQLISLQSRKFARLNYWKPIIARDVAIVLAIVWYIKVELLRSKQLPSYITYAGIDRVPKLKANIQKQASLVYSNLYRKDDKVNKFFMADTGHSHLDGKVGMISAYDTVKSCYMAQVCKMSQWDSAATMELAVSPENMEPYTWARNATYSPIAACDSCQISLENHFASSVSTAAPTVTFWPCVFSQIGGLSGSPHTGGEHQREKLMSMLNDKENIAKEKAAQLQAQQLELEKGLSKMYSTHQPVQKRPRSSVQRKKPKSKPPGVLQIKSVWEAKIKHFISKAGQKRDHSRERKEHENMFTFPFMTVDNSLYSSCVDLEQFSNHLQDDDIHDAVYRQNNFAPSIIVDETSVRSLSPGCNMDEDVMDFGLSW